MSVFDAILKIIEALTPVGGEVATLLGADPKDVEVGVKQAEGIEGIADKITPVISTAINGIGKQDLPASIIPTPVPVSPETVDEKIAAMEKSIASLTEMVAKIAAIHGG